MRALTLILALLAAPALAYDGLYYPDGYDGWDCTSIGSDGGALAVQDGIIFGVGNMCALTNAVPVRGLDATLYDAQCMGEGSETSERMMLMSTAEGLAIVRDGFVVLWHRC
ncbi:MAG: hypothetical protein AAGF60_07270 [Pseudomonadota bacterium]